MTMEAAWSNLSDYPYAFNIIEIGCDASNSRTGEIRALLEGGHKIHGLIYIMAYDREFRRHPCVTDDDDDYDDNHVVDPTPDEHLLLTRNLYWELLCYPGLGAQMPICLGLNKTDPAQAGPYTVLSLNEVIKTMHLSLPRNRDDDRSATVTAPLRLFECYLYDGRGWQSMITWITQESAAYFDKTTTTTTTII
jgi:hypothetical protein